jgi:hypothetical protein
MRTINFVVDLLFDQNRINNERSLSQMGEITKDIFHRNLYYAGNRIRLGGRMKVEQFSPRKDFLVPGFFAPKEAAALIEEKKVSIYIYISYI